MRKWRHPVSWGHFVDFTEGVVQTSTSGYSTLLPATKMPAKTFLCQTHEKPGGLQMGKLAKLTGFRCYLSHSYIFSPHWESSTWLSGGQLLHILAKTCIGSHRFSEEREIRYYRRIWTGGRGAWDIWTLRPSRVDPKRKAQSFGGWREFRRGQNICWDIRKLCLILELRVTPGTFGSEWSGWGSQAIQGSHECKYYNAKSTLLFMV